LRDPSVPDWLATAIERGLSTSPGDRYATMDELRGALDESEMWKAPMAIGVFALAIAVTAGVTVSKARSDAEVSRRCRAEADAIASSWSTAAREAVRGAILAAGDGDAAAPARAAQALERLDAYANDWQSEQSASCEATLIAKTQAVAVH